MSISAQQTFRDFVKSSIQQTLILIISLSSVVVASEILLRVAKPMRGRSSADAGIIMFEYGSVAWDFWLKYFLAASFLSLALLKLTISRNSNIPYWVIPAAMLPCLLSSALIINQ
jgi:hypothetical protein